ncbi:MAG: helix-turn-helix domain-containing protein [Elusimicrobiota bacterium]|nr:helix-turn-helix domain-containing protein [Elusimicrobiota bacterium]
MAGNKYLPDYVSPPGETLKETLEAVGMSQVQLAQRTGRPIKTINEIIKGKTALTSETALQLELVLGIPASFWNERERNYQEYLARKKEQSAFQHHLGWIINFPIKEMVERKLIPACSEKIETLQELLSFFGIATVKQWEQSRQPNNFSVAYRKSAHFESDKYAMSVWLRQGEREALKIPCLPYNKAMFCAALSKAKKLANKTDPKEFIPELMEICSRAGVAVVFVQELPKTCATGATRWLSKDKALIQLSLRHKTNDILWFTFFHEAGHILLHEKKKFFIEGVVKDAFEEEANKFAKDFLIDSKAYKRFVANGDFSREAVKDFSSRCGIPPAIVTGRLKHDKYLGWSVCSDLTVRYSWVKN